VRDGAIKAGDPINVTVPTGNFGNILAAYYAKQIGLPIHKLICASNENKVLFDFFSTGAYDKNRPFILTSSPSMDILVSSNLERLIYLISGKNAAKTAGLMKNLAEGGRYEIDAGMKNQLSDFYGAYANENEVSETIARIYKSDAYVLDPHTAVAAAVYDKYRKESGDTLPTVIASTASPYKFARSVLHAIDKETYDSMTDLEQFDALHEVSKVAVPQAIEEIKSAPIRHNTVAEVNEMEQVVKQMLGLSKEM
jgi:threonine synthase